MSAFLIGVLAAAVLLIGSLVLFTAWTAFRVERALPPHGAVHRDRWNAHPLS